MDLYFDIVSYHMSFGIGAECTTRPSTGSYQARVKSCDTDPAAADRPCPSRKRLVERSQLAQLRRCWHVRGLRRNADEVVVTQSRTRRQGRCRLTVYLE